MQVHVPGTGTATDANLRERERDTYRRKMHIDAMLKYLSKSGSNSDGK